VSGFDAEANSFEELFRRLLPDAVRVGQRIVTRESEAEDVAAEAFARALVRWRRLERLPYKDAWLLRTVTNVAIDVVRRRRDPLPEHEALVDPAEAVVLRLALATALERLPRRQQQVVTLRYLAGWPTQQVAESLGISLNTVKKHNNRAMTALRRTMGSNREASGAV
jgi:RNA polymerase sigma factor (sigma-70 family)